MYSHHRHLLYGFGPYKTAGRLTVLVGINNGLSSVSIYLNQFNLTHPRYSQTSSSTTFKVLKNLLQRTALFCGTVLITKYTHVTKA